MRTRPQHAALPGGQRDANMLCPPRRHRLNLANDRWGLARDSYLGERQAGLEGPGGRAGKVERHLFRVKKGCGLCERDSARDVMRWERRCGDDPRVSE